MKMIDELAKLSLESSNQWKGSFKKSIDALPNLKSKLVFHSGKIDYDSVKGYLSNKYYIEHNANAEKIISKYNLNTLKNSILIHVVKHTPYKYGAKGPKKYDCSGFTRALYNKHFKKIPIWFKNHPNDTGVRIISRYLNPNDRPLKQPSSCENIKAGSIIFIDSGIQTNRHGSYGHTAISLGGCIIVHSAAGDNEGVVLDNLKLYAKPKNTFYHVLAPI